MNTKSIREYKQTLRLKQEQREILVGLLLGDGHLESQNNGRTYRLKVEHGSKQVSYARWLCDKFQEWLGSGLRKKTRTDGNISYGFATYSHSAFRFYAHQFYIDGVKKIPDKIAQLLTPLGLAIWYMDDGSLKSVRHRSYVIHTLGYQRNELERAQKAILDLFGIKCKLHRQKDKHWRLYVISESANRFKELIAPYVHPSMKYKLENIKPKK